MNDDNAFVMGFDILASHSPRTKRIQKYACVIIRNNLVLNEHPEISRSAMLKMVREIRPKFLCTDNIFEIVPDSKSLFKLVESIPYRTKIVQVTGVPPKQIAIKTLAKRYGLKVHGKLTPLETARIAAQLAIAGVGHSLECFSEQTEIKVTRGRKMGKGGQSANRYRRRVHSEIQQMTRHIEYQLREAKIEFDIDIRISDFGYASARIIAYASLPVIKGFIKSKRGGDFNILISPVRKRTEFLPLEPKPIANDMRPRYFILGIDPGTTAAICLLTLNGKVHLLKSGKSFTRADIIRLVYENGIPILVASDVPKLPNFVERISRTMNVETFCPNKPIRVAEKQELAREFSGVTKIRNAHERDALTAAVYAYRKILPKLQQIDRKVRDEQIAVDRVHLKALVIKGMSVNDAIVSLLHEESEPVDIPLEPQIIEEPLSEEQMALLKAKIIELEKKNCVLTDKIKDAAQVIEYLRFNESDLAYSLDIVKRENYWRIKRDREIEKKQSELKQSHRENNRLLKEINSLNKQLELLRGVKIKELRGDMITVKRIEKFTQESIEEYMRKTSLLKHGDIVLFDDGSGGGIHTAGLLINHEIRAVIVDTPLSHLAKDELIKAIIPVIDADAVELQRIDEFAFISRKKFVNYLQTFIKEVREQARQKGEEKLIEIVEKYRREVER